MATEFRWGPGSRAGEPERLAPGAPGDLPAALAERLGELGARVTGHWREGPRGYLFADAPGGRLFARFAGERASADRAALAHEAAVRAVVGADGPLKAPPVLAVGEGWLVDRAVEPEPLRGAAAVDAILAAARALADLPGLPEAPAAPAAQRLAARLRRAPRIALAPVGLREVARSRRLLGGLAGAREVASHGDLQPRNLLWSRGELWVVDWELSGTRPAGFDLALLWPLLDEPADRERLWRGALELAGSAPGGAARLERLRHALLVRTIAGLSIAEDPIDRDRARARALARLLPEVRAAAAPAA